jgi:hypothetical protein
VHQVGYLLELDYPISARVMAWPYNYRTKSFIHVCFIEGGSTGTKPAMRMTIFVLDDHNNTNK